MQREVEREGGSGGEGEKEREKERGGDRKIIGRWNGRAKGEGEEGGLPKLAI